MKITYTYISLLMIGIFATPISGISAAKITNIHGVQSTIRSTSTLSLRPASFLVSSTTASSSITGTSTLDKVRIMQNDIRNRTEKKKAELNKQILEKKNNGKQGPSKKLDDKAAMRVKNGLGVIYGKFVQKLNRLARVDSELTRKISAVAIVSSSTGSSSPVASLMESQKKAKEMLVQARIDVEATRLVAFSEVATSTTRDTFKTLVGTADASIKATGEAYRKILMMLKPISNIASSTKTN